jgi:ribonuclease HIII
MVADLKKQGFEISIPPYTLFSAKKKGVSCTLYQSGKLTVQGKEMASFIEFYLEPEILQSFHFTYQELDIDKTARIGIDESGKGDFFGPLCIAGVFAEGDQVSHLKALGVRDSKKISDSMIVKIGNKIRAEYVHHIVKINPAKYNELIRQFGNLNRLLAWGHATAIEQLVIKTDCRQVLVDQFADEKVVLTALKRKNLELSLMQRHRAEEDLVVAAASILARQAFIEGLHSLGEEFSMKFPKGASTETILIGQKFVKKYGLEKLGKVGKLHFKTIDSIIKETSE